MALNEKAILKNRQSSYISSLSLDKDELKKLCDLLQERSIAAGEIEVLNFNTDGHSDEVIAQNNLKLRESFKLRVTLNGVNGEELHGPIEEVFSSVNFPEKVASIYLNSANVLKAVHNHIPLNSFEVYLDFSKPALYDFSLLPQQPTPNGSTLKVEGYDATWVNGVFHEISKFIEKRSSRFSKIHNHSVYDVLLWILGFPLSFWFSSKLSPYIQSLKIESVFFENALYVYSFVLSLFVFRFLFHYFRWVCPLVEYKFESSKVIAHRVFLGAVAFSIFTTFVNDIVKVIF